ncbi:hypothetical protein PRIPAC_80608 [Pristionchus pacificus]|uniref:Uncharacterized protein n=1 Tax=Pristionchus pacificus TaxID=54126 RepID=A0A2A6C390_PRIPA|nr:hypothetical protein PRIPAC_80608 [Pristionchus pacificus]|eukprot:PDM72596.1 hypothetical protein PRIPAC_39030 [Pristionchus pacificus]
MDSFVMYSMYQILTRLDSHSMLLFSLCLIVSLILQEAQPLSNQEKIQCFAAAHNIVEKETDKKLKKVIGDTLETITDLAMDVMLELNDEQIDRVVNHYFSGSCGDLKTLFQKF